MENSQIRDYIPVTNRAIYMNTGWAGPSPTFIQSRISEILESEASMGPGTQAALELGEHLSNEAKNETARLLHAKPEEILLTHSTTEGVNIILYGIGWQTGDEILTCNLEHPALALAAKDLEARHGVVSRVVEVEPQAEESEIIEAVVAGITQKTRLIALSHIQYSCGLVMPVRQITRIAHERDIPVLVDGAQSVGHIAVDLESLRCDYFAFSGQKWLMGPQGTGGLYIRTGSSAPIHPLFLKDGAGDVLDGNLNPLSLTSQNPGLIAGFTEAVKLALEHGQRQIELHNMGLANLLREHIATVPDCVLLSPPSGGSSCGLVTIRMEGQTSEDLRSSLEEHFGIIARTVNRPDGVRLSTSFFNTAREIGQIGSALRSLSSSLPV